MIAAIPILFMMAMLKMVAMTAQAADRDPKYQAGDRKDFGVAASVDVYVGAAVVFNGGYVSPFTTTLALKVFAGVAVEAAANGSGSAGDLTAQVYRKGVFEFVGSGLAETDIGREVWLSDDQTVTTTPQPYLPMGMIVDVPTATAPLVDITGYTTRSAGVFHLEYTFGNLNTVSTTVVTVPAGSILWDMALEVTTHVASSTVTAGITGDTNAFLDATSAAAAGFVKLAASDATTLGVELNNEDEAGSTTRISYGTAAAIAFLITTTNHEIAATAHYLVYLPGGNA